MFDFIGGILESKECYYPQLDNLTDITATTDGQPVAKDMLLVEMLN